MTPQGMIEKNNVLYVGMKVSGKILKRLFTKKQKKHEPETQKQKESKLLRFTRGNKALTPQQQQELFFLNEKNLQEIKRGLREMQNIWRNEHL